MGNHACVAVINNFIPKEDVWYFTRYVQSFKGRWELGRWMAKLGRFVAKLGRWVAQLERWVANLERWVAKLERWVAK